MAAVTQISKITSKSFKQKVTLFPIKDKISAVSGDVSETEHHLNTSVLEKTFEKLFAWWHIYTQRKPTYARREHANFPEKRPQVRRQSC